MCADVFWVVSVGSNVPLMSEQSSGGGTPIMSENGHQLKCGLRMVKKRLFQSVEINGGDWGLNLFQENSIWG